MLTPQFEISQTDNSVTLKIRLAHIRFSQQSLQIHIDTHIFLLSAPPYYLRLEFAGALQTEEDIDVDTPTHTTRFDPDSQTLTVEIPKKNPGEFFPDLDLPGKLMARAKLPPRGPLIQEIGSEEEPSVSVAPSPEIDWDSDVHADADSVVPSEIPATAHYGFENAYSGIIGVSILNGNDIADAGFTEGSSAAERAEARVKLENSKFDPAYYLGDLAGSRTEGDNLYEILHWDISELAEWSPSEEAADLSASEKELTKTLPWRDIPVENQKRCYLTALSVLLGFVYDARVNGGEQSVESAWTIGKLVPEISALDNTVAEGSVRQTVAAFVRRVFVFPLFRCAALAEKCVRDVQRLLELPRPARRVFRLCLKVREMFRVHDVYYVYCKVLLDDLCVWLHKSGDGVFAGLGRELSKLKFGTDELTELGFVDPMGRPVDFGRLHEMVEAGEGEDEG